MKAINLVRKTKERRLYLLDSLNELAGFNVEALLPPNADKVEIVCKQARENKHRFINGDTKGKYVLEIDYILSLDVTKLNNPVEVQENGK